MRWLLVFGAIIGRVSAAPVFFDNFESYNQGALDANLSATNGGVNSGPDGGPGNPWFRSNPPNLEVVGAENGVTPHSGTNMVRGADASHAPPQFDNDYVNLAYRFNQGNTYKGNVLLDWWFYDPLGAVNGREYSDYISLAFYDSMVTNTDYNATNPGPSGPLQRLSLGGTSNTNNQGGSGTSFDATKYQARIIGTTDGYNSNGWFNTPTARSVGWHHARIAVLPALTNGTANAFFYIDDLVHPTLAHNTDNSSGFNCIELNASYAPPGTTNTAYSAYYDDITFDVLPAPVLLCALSGNNLVLNWPNPYILQTATNLSSPIIWTDLTNAVSPYTNNVATNATLFFRLRN